jgi:hypothetical protein
MAPYAIAILSTITNQHGILRKNVIDIQMVLPYIFTGKNNLLSDEEIT